MASQLYTEAVDNGTPEQINKSRDLIIESLADLDDNDKKQLRILDEDLFKFLNAFKTFRGLLNGVR